MCCDSMVLFVETRIMMRLKEMPMIWITYASWIESVENRRGKGPVRDGLTESETGYMEKLRLYETAAKTVVESV
jgi:hypothetical protein